MDAKEGEMAGKFAEKHNSLAIFHTHGQFAEEGFDLDTLLGYSPANRLNLDVGHYYGATGLHPNEVIIKYHDKIPMHHKRHVDCRWVWSPVRCGKNRVCSRLPDQAARAAALPLVQRQKVCRRG